MKRTFYEWMQYLKIRQLKYELFCVIQDDLGTSGIANINIII